MPPSYRVNNIIGGVSPPAYIAKMEKGSALQLYRTWLVGQISVVSISSILALYAKIASTRS
jgi:hypothetical protein